MTHATARAGGALVGLALAALALPGGVAAHALSKSFESRLPLAVYLAGAGGAVALSFVFVLLRDLRASEPADDGRRVVVPRAVRLGLRAIGLIGWAWIVAQGVMGGESTAEVSRLFTWVYGWVGVALVSAFVFPIWTWLDPFSTLHELGARALRAAGIGGIEPAAYPARLGRWPAVVGFAAVVWLELVAMGAGSRTLALVITGYTVFTLAMMAQYGRRTWSEHGETFSVWFRLLGRLAPLAPVEEEAEGDGAAGGRLRRRGLGTGLLEAGWAVEDIVIIGLGTGSILFDGLSQTEIWVSTFGLPAALPQTLILAGFLGLIAGAALVVARLVGVPGTAAGLLPIAVGYLLAHYFTYLVIDGQRIVIAISDPLQQGSDLFGTAFFEPTGAWLPPGLVWTLQLGAVVGGHMLGAWAGHVVAASHAGRLGTLVAREIRLRQVPLAAVMVSLTTLTLWSLGQALFIPPPS
ncbi:MAG TPA: hypothetical protein VLS28_10320 [Candidatus Sulfomarinibacteraceae bacterium]|nr:hypothetical protein [Candidatus Sulfomarinibacteraceae bacterium]